MLCLSLLSLLGLLRLLGLLGGLSDHRDNIADRDLIALLFHDLLQHTARFRADLDIDLVGFEFYQGITLIDTISLMLEPCCDDCAHYRFSQRRNTYFNGHIFLPFIRTKRKFIQDLACYPAQAT